VRRESKDLVPEAPDSRGFVFELVQEHGRLALLARHHPDFGSVVVDWDSADQRRRIAAGRRQLLARAVGLHKKRDLTILDATAGLGRDAFTLAALGARVTLCERQPLMAKLLRDGIERARATVAISAIADRIELREGDARRALHDGWDTIYLDPMYPGHDRDAKSKKELQFLRELAGDDPDAGELLELALAAKVSRVVVKRPRSAPLLSAREPTYAISGTQARFDVYLPQGMK
jgi:16S rRNA (guanine1516-N2)-methyltransferase